MSIVGIDIGGTFTDLVGYHDGAIVTSKCSTVPADPTEGAAQALRIAGCDVAAMDELLHGSTIAINTVLERSGARTALVTTQGFRDIYAIGRGNRPDAFNLFFHRPRPLVPRELTFELAERMNAAGEVLVPLGPAAIEILARRLAALGVEAIAVCLLHSYANPAHEIMAGEVLRRLLPDPFVTLSHEILREFREYERTSTTVLNAFVGPRVSRYLGRFQGFAEEARFGGKIAIMRSNGGTMSIGQARREPVAMMESGPVAGMIGAGRLASLLGIERAIGFDMGGTTAKTTLITSGIAPIEEGYVIGDEFTGQPMQLPVVDIVEVGAGGGSLAWCDGGGGLHVGPVSAGADPGPACYGRGGQAPTLTDALVLLGHLNPTALLEGAMPIDAARAREAVVTRVAEPLGMSAIEAAWGILRVLATNVMVAMRTITVERGYDPREFALVPFGGMGPTIAGLIAAELGIGRILIPRDPGTFSAYGMLVTDVQQERSRTRIMPVDATTPAELDAIFAEMEAAALADLMQEQFPRERLQTRRHAGMRYRGQSYEVSVPVPSLRGPDDLADLVRRFHDAHQRRYGHMAQAEAVEIVNFQVTAVGLIPKPAMKTYDAADAEAKPHETRQAYFNAADARDVPVFRRSTLQPGIRLEGPTIIEEQTSTTVLYPDQRAEVDAYLNIDVEVPGK